MWTNTVSHSVYMSVLSILIVDEFNLIYIFDGTNIMTEHFFELNIHSKKSSLVYIITVHINRID